MTDETDHSLDSGGESTVDLDPQREDNDEAKNNAEAALQTAVEIASTLETREDIMQLFHAFAAARNMLTKGNSAHDQLRKEINHSLEEFNALIAIMDSLGKGRSSVLNNLKTTFPETEEGNEN